MTGFTQIKTQIISLIFSRSAKAEISLDRLATLVRQSVIIPRFECILNFQVASQARAVCDGG